MPAIPPLLPSPLVPKKKISQDIQRLEQGLKEKDEEISRMKLATLTGFLGIMLFLGLDGCTTRDAVSRIKNVEGEVQKLQQKLQQYEDRKFNQKN